MTQDDTTGTVSSLLVSMAATTQKRSCIWGFLAIILLVTLERAFIGMERYGGIHNQVICGKPEQDIPSIDDINSPVHQSLRKSATAKRVPVYKDEAQLPTSFEGIRARPFVYSKNQSLPCFPPEEDWMSSSIQSSPVSTALSL